MSQALPEPGPERGRAKPTWEIAYLFPAHGDWREEEYLALHGNRLVAFSDGVLDALPFLNTSHQLLVTHRESAGCRGCR
jgi:hypothetical protein